MACIKLTQLGDKRAFLEAELRSLGIEPGKKNELNDEAELQNLIDNVKESMFQDYKTAHSENGDHFKEEAKSTIGI